MRPTNLNQVFVINDALNATGTVFDKYNGTNSFSSLTAATMRGGVWGYDAVAGTAFQYQTTSLVANPSVESFQIVQGTMGSYPIATPLIRPKQIRRVKYLAYQATQRHQQLATFAAAVPAGQTYLVKVQLRAIPMHYEAFSNPTNAALDLTSSGKTFPVLGNFAAGRMIFPVVEVAAGTSHTSGTTIAQVISNAIAANTTLNNMFSASVSSVSVTNDTVTIIARHAGTIFDFTVMNSVTYSNVFANASNGTLTTTAYDAGVGNYWQVISDEKQQRARYGNFNRMYFPVAQVDYAQSSLTYDTIEVSYDHGHPADTGIARAGEWNTVRIYIKAGQLAVASVDWDTLFGLTAGTPSEVYY